MNGLERPLKALANRRRLAIIKYLKAHREAPVNEIASVIKLSFRSTSKHLAILTAVDILERNQQGLQVLYRLAEAPPPPARAIIRLV